ncbi:MAG: signal recognition particle-docking protein FtsY [Alphaproteobacteria bacterium]|nr:signal recognition particle-docking protein FtsY [Alphaproteobacteria bacterium]
MSWFNRLKEGLKKTSEKISGGISNIVTKKKLDTETLNELEELLISADLGATASQKIIQELSKSKFNKEVDSLEVKSELQKIISRRISKSAAELKIKNKPHVILTCGVNGNGKTTTIGKLSYKYKKSGKSVTIGSCDTFRAAALEQLEIWAKRAKADLISGPENSDPASVAYKALTAAKESKSDVLFLDTAGRLSNKSHLMEELAKIVKVIKKIDPEAPHECILVLDATTGQNAVAQVESFKETVDLTGLIITKLDGSAKAGILVELSEKFGLPIFAVGVGESIDDLNSFIPEDFTKNLLGLK